MNTNPHAGHSHHSREDVGANRQEDVHGQSPVDAHAQGHSREALAGSIYTCPMHPEIRQDRPGNCPKCGMALEPLLPDLEETENPELADFRRRFWWTLPLTVIVTVMAMFGHRLGWFDMARQSWIELALTLPIVLWAGAPFFARGARSVVNRSPNMWTLIGPGHRRGVRLQRRGYGRTAGLSGLVRLDGPRGGLLRGRGRHHLVDAARPDSGIEGALADLGGHQVIARPRAEDRATHCT